MSAQAKKYISNIKSDKGSSSAKADGKAVPDNFEEYVKNYEHARNVNQPNKYYQRSNSRSNSIQSPENNKLYHKANTPKKDSIVAPHKVEKKPEKNNSPSDSPSEKRDKPSQKSIKNEEIKAERVRSSSKQRAAEKPKTKAIPLFKAKDSTKVKDEPVQKQKRKYSNEENSAME